MLKASDGERQRDDGEGRLGDEEELVAVDPVGDHAGPGAEHEDGQELRSGGETEREAVVGQTQDHPDDGDRLHPRAGLRDELAEEEQPEVAGPERAERVVGGIEETQLHMVSSRSIGVVDEGSACELLEHVGDGLQDVRFGRSDLLGAGSPGGRCDATGSRRGGRRPPDR